MFYFNRPTTVGGILEDTLSNILNLIDNSKDRNFFESQLNQLKTINWKIWIARWFVLAYYYPNYDSKKILKMVSKVKKLNNLTEKQLKFVIKDIQSEEFIKNIGHAETMSEIHGLKIITPNLSVTGKQIKNIEFNWENPIEFLKHYYKSEEAFNRKHSAEKGKGGKKIVLKSWDDYRIIHDFGNNLYWLDLQTNYSREEAENMGHCGSAPAGSTLISLRTLHGNPGFEYFEVHVTLVLSKEGYMTQIKGKANSTVPLKYKKYVQDFIIDVPDCIGTATGEFTPPGQKDYEESAAIVGSKEDLDYLLNNRKGLFDFSDLFINLLKVQNLLPLK